MHPKVLYQSTRCGPVVRRSPVITLDIGRLISERHFGLTWQFLPLQKPVKAKLAVKLSKRGNHGKRKKSLTPSYRKDPIPRQKEIQGKRDYLPSIYPFAPMKSREVGLTLRWLHKAAL